MQQDRTNLPYERGTHSGVTGDLARERAAGVFADLENFLLLLKYDGLRITRPNRFREECLLLIPPRIEKGLATLEAGCAVDITIEGFRVLSDILRFFNTVLELPDCVEGTVRRFKSESEFRTMRRGDPVIFMGLDRIEHQAVRGEKAAYFRQLGLEIGTAYQIAQLPNTDFQRRFAIHNPFAKELEMDLTCFGITTGSPG